ncbi:MAG TPA: hypothetical protein VFL93_08385 [Longimicrobiaceae bacterium]|jgi:hypothetical protein|nr:hypothetical protein [Longimicrobiaceae bacterium]
MLTQEVVTDLPPAEVIARAREFFALRFNQYAIFEIEEGDAHIRFRTDLAELVIGTGERNGQTVVRGATSRLHHELSQFLLTLAPSGEVRQNVVGPGVTGAG